MAEMLMVAQRKRYALGYFESWNLESTRAVAETAEEERSPLIVGFNGSFLEAHKYHLEYYASIGRAAAELATVPATLLLNEVSGFQQIIRAIRFGFSAVMIDVSSSPFEASVKQTKRIVEAAHSADVCVEAQFDTLPAAKDGVLEKAQDIIMTDPKKAAKFVEETGVDALSISIGNVHGLYRGKAVINFRRLQEIEEEVETPLVLHGATGISDEDVEKAIDLGVCKINIGHALRLAFARVVRDNLEKGVSPDLEKISDLAENEMKDLIRRKMKIYGCSGRA